MMRTSHAGIHQILIQPFLLTGICLLTSCASIRGTGTSNAFYEDPREAFSNRTSTFDGYQMEGGAWVSGQPLFLNRDFDFSLAAIDELGGPGVAAAKRLSENQRVASLLANMADLPLVSVFQAAINECGRQCAALEKSRVRLFVVLFGENEVRLQTVLEIDFADATKNKVKAGPPLRLLVVSSEKRPLETGNDAWIANHGQAIAAATKRAIPRLIEVYLGQSREPINFDSPKGENFECPLQTSYRAQGFIASRFSDHAVFIHREMPHTLISCEY